MFARVRLRLGAAIAAAILPVTRTGHAATVASSFATGQRGRIAPLPPAMAPLLAGIAGLRRHGPRAA